MKPLIEKCENYTTSRDVKKSGLYPYFHELQSRQDVEVIMEGKRRIMLGSNNYLGLTVNEEVIKAGVDALNTLGSGCSGSRFLNGTLNLHVQLEKELAEFVNKEAAVAFSTGFQSNLGIISGLCGKNDFIFCDRENHASIYDACRLSGAEIKVYRHSNMDLLEKKLASVDIDAGKLIVTDGVFSMGGDICKLPEIVELAKKYKAAVMVDDAHGLGVIGEGGRGTASHFGLTDEVDVIMGTFSKSLASLGGFMAADETVCEYIRHNSRPFIFSASIPPASCATALTALRIIKENPSLVDHLSELSVYMKRELKERGVRLIESPTPIIPLYTTDMMTTLKIAKTLYDRGVYVNPVLPPATPPNECLLRVSLMASHTKELIDEAVGIIATTMKEAGLTDE
ncbi:MAG: pyridoxal phosphate-dependent aminotransferase family protein [Clostridia bacterium]|nr:pyridoxal phosphate-dependent aminotransferase family protein [Clostridia bacterium]